MLKAKKGQGICGPSPEGNRTSAYPGQREGWGSEQLLCLSLDKPKWWANESLTRVNKAKCKVMAISDTPIGWAVKWLRSALLSKAWMMVDEKLDMSRQCVLTAWKGSGILGCTQSSTGSRSEEEILSLYSALVRSHLDYWGHSPT